MDFEPYLFFYGRCEEALNFYKGVFGGNFTLNRFEGTPMEKEVPDKSKIIHATFEAPDVKFMAGEGRPSGQVGEGNISLSLATNDEARGTAIFDKLARGGKVEMPIQDVFWGGKFGTLKDQFGIDWLVSIHP